MINIKKNTLIRVGIILLIIFIGVIFLILSNATEDQSYKTSQLTDLDDTPLASIDGKQIINIKAKNGYTPYIIEAKANVDSILRVNTNNTFDCSLALRIPTLNVDQMLPITGNTDFNIPSQESGSEINGTCSMGMYSFKINFVD